jgi:hypothetical protein
MRADLAADLACALDPVALARRTGLAPDPWQARVLRSTARQLHLNCSRQVGKSTIVAILAAHGALYDPGSPTLILSPSLRQSSLLFGKVKTVLRGLGSGFSDLATDNALSVTLGNGSEIHSLPGKAGTVRGFSGVRLLIIDEAAYVADELYRAVRPMLAVSGGRLALLSSPFGQRGFFFEEGKRGGERWEHVEVDYRQCPRMDPDFIAEERRALGIFFAQEYECAFLDTVNAAFLGADIDRAFANDVQPLFPLD